MVLNTFLQYFSYHQCLNMLLFHSFKTNCQNSWGWIKACPRRGTSTSSDQRWQVGIFNNDNNNSNNNVNRYSTWLSSPLMWLFSSNETNSSDGTLLTLLRIPTGRRRTSGLFYKHCWGFKLRITREQIQPLVVAGLKLRTSSTLTAPPHCTL